MYRSYSVNNMPEPVRFHSIPPPKGGSVKAAPEKRQEVKQKAACDAKKREDGIFDIKTDDIILIAVALVLLIDDCDDIMLLMALGIVLFSDYFGFN